MAIGASGQFGRIGSPGFIGSIGAGGGVFILDLILLISMAIAYRRYQKVIELNQAITEKPRSEIGQEAVSQVLDVVESRTHPESSNPLERLKLGIVRGSTLGERFIPSALLMPVDERILYLAKLQEELCSGFEESGGWDRESNHELFEQIVITTYTLSVLTLEDVPAFMEKHPKQTQNNSEFTHQWIGGFAGFFLRSRCGMLGLYALLKNDPKVKDRFSEVGTAFHQFQLLYSDYCGQLDAIKGLQKDWWKC